MPDVYRELGLEPGMRIRAKWRGTVLEGVVMPRHAFSGEKTVILKLDSGYNVGIDAEEAEFEILPGRVSLPEHAAPEPEPRGLPRVSLLGTGGTIASYVDYRTGGVVPVTTPGELLQIAPEIGEIADLEVDLLFSVFSEEMKPEHWARIAKAAYEKLKGGSSGVVVLHGTDTMSFTSAALSFMIKDPAGPVVLTGSQRSSDRPSSDAFENLLFSTMTALSDLGEVVVVMHSSTSDGEGSIIRGTRVRKMHSSRRDAFVSIDVPPIGRVTRDGVEFLSPHRPRGGDMELLNEFRDRACLLYFYPGMEGERVLRFAEGCEALIIAGTGLGHVNRGVREAVRALTRDGVFVGVTTQCIWGTVNLNVYASGRELLLAGATPLGDMLPEVAYVKATWALARAGDLEEMRRIMTSNLAGEISEGRDFRAYLGWRP